MKTFINGRVNNDEAGDLRCHRAYYDVTVMVTRSVEHITIAKKLNKVLHRINYILDTLSTVYTQDAINDSSRYLTVFVQHLWFTFGVLK